MSNANVTPAAILFLNAALATARRAHFFDVDVQAVFLRESHRASSKADMLTVCRDAVLRLYDLPDAWWISEGQAEKAMEAVNDFADALANYPGDVVLLGSTFMAA